MLQCNVNDDTLVLTFSMLLLLCEQIGSSARRLMLLGWLTGTSVALSGLCAAVQVFYYYQGTTRSSYYVLYLVGAVVAVLLYYW